MIYEENIIVNIKNIVNNELKELPNIIFYMNQEKKEKIENIIKIFDIKNNVVNLNFEIKDEQKPKKKIKKEYYGYNQLDFVFLNKKEQKIESNKIYSNILKKNEIITFKENYVYFIEIKLSFPIDPKEKINKLFQKAKNFYSLYQNKYNLRNMGIILIYDTKESGENNFSKNYQIVSDEISFL